MRIEQETHRERRTTVAAMWEMQRMRVSAPRHPLADPAGMVPIEVFEVPPELVDVVRTLPIRSVAASPVAPVAPVVAPRAARIVSEATVGAALDVLA